MGEWPPLSVKIKVTFLQQAGLVHQRMLSVAAAGAPRCARGKQLIGDDWAEGFSAANPNNVYQGPWENSVGDSILTGNKSVDVDECAILAHAVEAHAQGGRASPLDSSTCSHGGCIVLSDKIESGLDWLYTRRLNDVSWEVHSVELPSDINDVWLVIGNTEVHAPTADQVSKVANLLKENPDKMKEIETIGIVARRGINALVSGDMEGGVLP